MGEKTLVVVPTYNRPSLCRRAIESLLAQDHADWELVIAKNGGAEDLERYFRTLKRYLTRTRVRMLVLPDKGLGYALNEAVAHFGNQRYFAILEDDDEWEPDFLSSMLQLIETSGADVVHCMQRQHPEQKQSNGAPMDLGRLRTVNWINFPMCLFRTVLFHDIGGFTNAAGPATDWDWHLRCVAAGAKYKFLNRTLVTHHWHNQNYCLKSDGRPFIMDRMGQGCYDY